MRIPITASQRTGEYGGDGSSSLWDGHGDGGLSPEASGSEKDAPWEPLDMGGFPTGLSLVRVCLRTVAKDPEIILLHIMSYAFSLSLLIIYLALVLGDLSESSLSSALADPSIIIVLFPYFIIAGAVGIFFRAASIAIASIRLRGGDPVARDGLVAAGRRVHLIIAWAVITAVVTVVTSILRSKSRGGSRLLVEGASLAWGIVTYFVIPVMLFENLGPIEAIDRSARIVRRTWREALGGNFGIGLIMLAVAVPGILLYPIGAMAWGMAGGVGLVLAYWIFVSLIFAAVGSVLVAALYEVAVAGRRPEGFDGFEDLSTAFLSIRRLKEQPGPRTADSVRDSQMMYIRR